MGKELSRLLAALGTGAVAVLGAYLASWTPASGTSPMTFAIGVAIVAVIKRGVDWLVAKAPAPTP